LQLLMPAHMTDMPAAWAVVTPEPMANRAAAVVANATADLKVDDMVFPLKVKNVNAVKVAVQTGLVLTVLSACLPQSVVVDVQNLHRGVKKADLFF